MEDKLQRALYATVKYWDGPIERHMKHKAPWTDRTTNARNGLFATAEKSGSTIAESTFAIVLGHSVDYGVYLELGHHHEPENGEPYDVPAYPIVLPTIELYAPKVIKTLTKILDRLG
jgi:hypothetical protein